MSTDLRQFYQVFFEEAAELLAEMETRLLGLDAISPGTDDLNAIFRAAHSIKGGAGTFGFNDMTELTHVLESLLDKLRKGELELQVEMIDTFLKAGDVLKGQLAGHRGDGAADGAAAAEVCATLKRLATAGPVSALPVAPATAAASQSVATISAAAGQPAAAAQQVYRIEFLPPAGNAAVLDHLLSDLAQHGTLENLGGPVAGESEKSCTKTGRTAGKKTGTKARRKTRGKADKSAEQNAVRQCVLRLTTGASEEDIWEALAFVVDPANLKIELEPASVASRVAAPPAADGSQSDCGFGFFKDAPAAPAMAESTLVNASAGESARSPGRRATDVPDVAAAKAGRRANDKVAVTAAGESSTIRVSIEKVDEMINLVGELVITQAMLAQIASQVDAVVDEKLVNGMSQLERNTRDLQESVMSIRMMPISFVFSRFPRVVRDLAAKLDKQIELKTEGDATELDKGLIEKIADPLTHLVRNSLDHGIEPPDVRTAAGKAAKGTILLRAFHQGGNIIIEVSDDGAGLRREKILAKARERGLAVHDAMPDQDVWQLIFEAGFSTADVVTDVSGRGVGMDVVKRNIQAMGGRVEIDSAPGVGTRISIRLPLTLAILDGLSVSVGGELFILPLTYITESLQPSAADVKTLSGCARVVKVRGEYLPVIALHEVFNLRPEVAEVHEGIVVILEAEGRKTALFVDSLVGQHQVVIKSLESNYRRVRGVSGATIMGDGRVALILDAVAIANETRRAPVGAA